MRKSFLLRGLPLLVVVAGCGPSGDPADGVITPRVSTSRIEVFSGGVLELGYYLDIHSEAPRFDQEYGVAVAFLSPEGETLWRDDHPPPVPSTSWLSGRTIFYLRPVFVPASAPAGTATIALSLQTPGGKRLALNAEDLGDRVYRVGSVRVDAIADLRWVPRYETGFHPREANRSDTWRWTTGEATVSFRNPGEGCVLYLTLEGRPGLSNTPQKVSLTVRDRIVDSFEVASRGKTTRIVEMDPDVVGSADPFKVVISVDQTFVPAGVSDATGDTRELGVRVFSAIIDPKTVLRGAAGLRDTESDEENRLFRWSGRRALIFGPPWARRLELPLRRSPGLAQTVRVFLNGQPAEELVLDDDAWRQLEYEMPAPLDGVVRVELLIAPVTRVEGDPQPRGLMVGDYRWRR